MNKIKINRDIAELRRLDELGEAALKSPKLMDLVVNGATLMSVNKDTLRGIIRMLLSNGIPHWIPVSERLPEAEMPVLICATRKFCNEKEAQIRSLAMYEDGKTTTDNSAFDWDGEDFEYDEKSDSFLIPEGWWEYPVYSESFSAVDDFVTHWVTLPQPPKEKK